MLKSTGQSWKNLSSCERSQQDAVLSISCDAKQMYETQIQQVGESSRDEYMKESRHNYWLSPEQATVK